MTFGNDSYICLNAPEAIVSVAERLLGGCCLSPSLANERREPQCARAVLYCAPTAGECEPGNIDIVYYITGYSSIVHIFYYILD